MKYRFDPQKFRIGMRTFKTGLSVFFVLLLFILFDWEGLQIGALTAVFSLREDLDRTVSFGFSRILGNSIGGLLALVFYFFNALFQQHILVTLILVPILTMLTIMFNVAFNNKSGIIGAVAALLIITLSIPTGHTFICVSSRVFETLCEVFVAIWVNADVELIKNRWFKKKSVK